MSGRVDCLTMVSEEITNVKRTVTNKVTNVTDGENYTTKTYEFITSNDRDLVVLVREETICFILKPDSIRDERSIELSLKDFRALIKLNLAD